MYDSASPTASPGPIWCRMKSPPKPAASIAEPGLFARTTIEERPQFVAPAGVAQFSERLGLDLADAFPRYREVLADLFESVLTAVLQTEAHLDDLLLTRGEGLQDFGGLLPQVEIDDRFRRRHHPLIHDEIAKVRLFFLADLCRAVDAPLSIDFMAVSPYTPGVGGAVR